MATINVRARWAVPAGAVAVTGIVIAAAAVASADSAPSLPPRTPAQLLAEVAQGTAKPLGPLTATVQQTSDLGLPALPALGQQDGGPSLGTSQETTSIWYRDPQHIRVAEQVPAGETDLRLDGRTLWVWDSKTQTATKYALPAHGSQAGSGAGPNSVPELPQSAAAQLLTAVGPTTIVSVQRNVYVAGQAAYQLSLVPRSSKSLVGSVLIAIDASRHIPLRVEVYPRGSSAVAYSIGFTALSFGTPAASNFSFTPPPGATVRNVSVPGNLTSILGPAGPLLRSTLIPTTVLPARVGTPITAELLPARLRQLHMVRISNGKMVVRKPATARQIIVKLAPAKLKLAPALPGPALKQIEAQFAKSLPASMSKAQRAAAIKSFGQHVAQHLLGQHLIVKAPVNPKLNNGGGFINVRASYGNGRHVIGTSWLSVLATPPSPAVAAAVKQALNGGGVSAGQAGPELAVLQALVKATVPVHGSWGAGRLLKTTLLTVLVTSKGQILAGAVTPSVLYSDVAADAG